MQKKLLLLLFSALPYAVWAQCNTSDATDCGCLDGSTDCDLLPDMRASYLLLADPEYQPEEEYWLGVSVATPNTGHGPLRVIPTDYFVCGGDTIYSPEGLDACTDGSAPKQIINQRIFHKNGDEMTYTDRNAGTMTYHPGHGHFHVDDWGVYTLRKEMAGVENPLDWPIIGSGAKLGFCLMDYGSCGSGYYNGYCVDDAGETVGYDNPNYGLGGGSFDCGLSNQGISAGYLDIYHYWLDGMNIVIPPGVCNGDYKIVVEVDPNNYFLEESDANNLMVADITLTEQPEDVDFIPITVDGDVMLCGDNTVTLNAPIVGSAYSWNTGETTTSITVSEPGSYYCLVERDCGPLYTDTIIVTSVDITEPTVVASFDVCEGTSGTVTASADGIITWYDALVGGTAIGSGASFTTPALYENTMYYVDNYTTTSIPGEAHLGETSHEGSEYSTSPYNGYQVFDALTDFTLESVTVFTEYPGERIIELRDASETVLDSKTVMIGEGTSVIDLNFEIAAGTDYHLGTNDDENETEFGNINPYLQRSDEGTSYPYSVSDIVNITGSSYDNSRWYYFYDWKVSYEKTYTCNSDRVPVEAKVLECVGISEVAGIHDLQIFPNPSNGTFQVSYSLNENESSEIHIINNLGEIVATQIASKGTNNLATFNLSQTAPGIYTIEIVSGNKSIHKQIVIE